MRNEFLPGGTVIRPQLGKNSLRLFLHSERIFTVKRS
jgi:hypothetical protein